MSVTKVMMVFVLVLAVTMAADAGSKKTNSGKVQPVGSLVAKASLSPVNATVNGTVNANVNATVNATESMKSTEKVQVTKRSLGIDKSEGKSQLMSAWWRIPTALWNFISQVFIDPLVSVLRQVLSIFGIDTDQMMNFPTQMQSQTPMDFVSQLMPQFTTPVNPTFA